MVRPVIGSNAFPGSAAISALLLLLTHVVQVALQQRMRQIWFHIMQDRYQPTGGHMPERPVLIEIMRAACLFPGRFIEKSAPSGMWRIAP